MEQPRIELCDSPALARVNLWPLGATAEGIDPAAIIVSHIKASKIGGVQAKLVRMAVSVPGMMEKGLASDYKKRLY